MHSEFFRLNELGWPAVDADELLQTGSKKTHAVENIQHERPTYKYPMLEDVDMDNAASPTPSLFVADTALNQSKSLNYFESSLLDDLESSMSGVTRQLQRKPLHLASSPAVLESHATTESSLFPESSRSRVKTSFNFMTLPCENFRDRVSNSFWKTYQKNLQDGEWGGTLPYGGPRESRPLDITFCSASHWKKFDISPKYREKRPYESMATQTGNERWDRSLLSTPSRRNCLRRRKISLVQNRISSLSSSFSTNRTARNLVQPLPSSSSVASGTAYFPAIAFTDSNDADSLFHKRQRS